MGKADDRPRATRRLEPVRLAALADETRESPAAEPPTHELPEGIAIGRAKTIDDPLTTAMLAEVARSHTQEFDDDLIEEIKSGHPHVTRRSS